MQVGDLVQVLPTKIGYYIVLGKAKVEDEYVGRQQYWDLAPLDRHKGTYGGFRGPMAEQYIEVVSEKM
jgi:hypothetical protein